MCDTCLPPMLAVFKGSVRSHGWWLLVMVDYYCALNVSYTCGNNIRLKLSCGAVRCTPSWGRAIQSEQRYHLPYSILCTTVTNINVAQLHVCCRMDRKQKTFVTLSSLFKYQVLLYRIV